MATLLLLLDFCQSTVSASTYVPAGASLMPAPLLGQSLLLTDEPPTPGMEPSTDDHSVLTHPCRHASLSSSHAEHSSPVDAASMAFLHVFMAQLFALIADCIFAPSSTPSTYSMTATFGWCHMTPLLPRFTAYCLRSPDGSMGPCTQPLSLPPIRRWALLPLLAFFLASSARAIAFCKPSLSVSVSIGLHDVNLSRSPLLRAAPPAHTAPSSPVCNCGGRTGLVPLSAPADPLPDTRPTLGLPGSTQSVAPYKCISAQARAHREFFIAVSAIFLADFLENNSKLTRFCTLPLTHPSVRCPALHELLLTQQLAEATEDFPLAHSVANRAHVAQFVDLYSVGLSLPPIACQIHAIRPTLPINPTHSAVSSPSSTRTFPLWFAPNPHLDGSTRNFTPVAISTLQIGLNVDQVIHLMVQFFLMQASLACSSLHNGNQWMGDRQQTRMPFGQSASKPLPLSWLHKPPLLSLFDSPLAAPLTPAMAYTCMVDFYESLCHPAPLVTTLQHYVPSAHVPEAEGPTNFIYGSSHMPYLLFLYLDDALQQTSMYQVPFDPRILKCCISQFEGGEMITDTSLSYADSRITKWKAPLNNPSH